MLPRVEVDGVNIRHLLGYVVHHVVDQSLASLPGFSQTFRAIHTALCAQLGDRESLPFCFEQVVDAVGLVQPPPLP